MEKNTSLDSYYFHQGTNYEAYKFLGCNFEFEDGKFRYSFRTWAPNANSVGLISDFGGWDNPIPLTRITDNGVWELIYYSDHSLEKQAYKFRIKSKSGTVDKGDPYARFSRGKADGASLIFASSDFKWTDSAWMRKRNNTITTKKGSYIPTPVSRAIEAYPKRFQPLGLRASFAAVNGSTYLNTLVYLSAFLKAYRVPETPFLAYLNACFALTMA